MTFERRKDRLEFEDFKDDLPHPLSNGGSALFVPVPNQNFIEFQFVNTDLKIPQHLAGFWTDYPTLLAATETWLQDQGISISRPPEKRAQPDPNYLDLTHLKGNDP